MALREVSLARLAEIERAVREYLGGDVDLIGRERADRPHPYRRRRARRRPAGGGVQGEAHEGACWIPLEELEDRLAELPADRDVVAYCRGPLCAFAHEAVRRVQAEAAMRAAPRTAGPNGLAVWGARNRAARLAVLPRRL